MASVPASTSQVQGAIGSPVMFRCFLGKGFSTVKTTDSKAVRKLLLSPFRLVAGLCGFQRWVPNFDPRVDKGIQQGNAKAAARITIPIWITLRNLQDKFRDVAQQIVAGLGEVLGEAPDNSDNKDPSFYIGLQSGIGWEYAVTVTNQLTQLNSTISIDYTHLPIRCRYYGDITHCL
jgi:hypothetical protein